MNTIKQVILGLALLFMFACSDFGQQPVGSLKALFEGQYPQIASGDAKNVFAVWFNQRKIQFAMSANGGDDFSAPLDISSTGKAQPDPAIVVGQNGFVSLAWSEFTETSRVTLFSHSQDGGKTFSSAIQLNNPAEGATEAAQIAVDRENNIYVIWVAESSHDSRVFLTGSSDGGRSFSTPQRLSSGEGFDTAPQVAADSNGDVYALWAHKSTDSELNTLMLRHSSDRGKTFSPESAVTSPGLIYQPALSAAGAGELYLVWMQPAGILFSSSSDGGTSFSAPKVLGQGIFPDISARADKSVFIAWYNNGIALGVSRDGGMSFLPLQKLGEAQDPKVALDPDKNGYVIAWQPSGASAVINFARNSLGVSDPKAPFSDSLPILTR